MTTDDFDIGGPGEVAAGRQRRQRHARIALACLDLTSLGDDDTPARVEALCARARDARFGHPAAVCVWPRYAGLARSLLPPSIAVAAVANFPDGGSDVARALADCESIVQAGAQEVDLVLPWRDLDKAPALLRAVRDATPAMRLKVIVESGELADAARIERAARIAIDAGADFIKTSTGKTPHGATPEAARAMLGAIAGAADAAARARVGFKASGGVRSIADAATYIELTSQLLGPGALVPARLRIGASSLLDAIEAVLGCGSEGGVAAAAEPAAPAY